MNYSVLLSSIIEIFLLMIESSPKMRLRRSGFAWRCAIAFFQTFNTFNVEVSFLVA
jgi:hypothetical protein